MKTRIINYYMKPISIAAAVLFLSACGGSSDRSAEVVAVELEKAKEAYAELDAKIEALETELAAFDTTIKKEGTKVTVKVIKPEPFRHYFKVGASAEAKQKSYISPEMGGQIKHIHVKEGQRVKKGQLLVTINSSSIQSQIAELKTALELSTTVYEKQKELWDQGIGSEIQFLETKTNKESLEQKLVTAKTQLDMTTIEAPFDGIVDEIIGKVGEMSSPGFELVRMVNLSQIEISADVSEAYLGIINQGDMVSIVFPSLNNKTVKAKITRTGNIINSANRTFKVVVAIPNRDETIKPNMVAVLEFLDYENNGAMIVPSMIVKSDVTGKNFFFLAEEKGDGLVAKKIFVEPGHSYLDMTEVVAGLSVGDKVVIDGFNAISDGVLLDVVN